MKPKGNFARTYRGPKKFVPPSAYVAGEAPKAIQQPMKENSTMGIAAIVEEIRADSPLPPVGPSGPAPHKAGVLHLSEDGTPLNPRTMPPPAPAEKAADEVLVTTRPRRIFEGDEPTEAMDEPSEAVESSDAMEADLPEVEKVRLNAHRKITDQGQEIAALKKQLQDVLDMQRAKLDTPETKPAPVLDVSHYEREIEAVAKKFLDDPEGSAKKIAELSMKAAQASVVPILKQNEERAAIEATKALVRQYPGLITNKAEAAYVDSAAEMLAESSGHAGTPTMEHYQQALDDYAKRVGYKKAAATRQPNPEVERMKQEGQSAPSTATQGGKEKGKIWKRSELEALLTKYPDKYKALQPEILRAYRENRVR